MNAVKFFPSTSVKRPTLLTGSADRSIRVWQLAERLSESTCLKVLEAHKDSINAISTVPGSNIFVTAAADSTVCVWRLDVSEQGSPAVTTSFHFSTSYIPLALCLHRFPSPHVQNSYILAVAGTQNSVHLHTIELEDGPARCILQATLSGHEGWIRSLTACSDSKGDVLLASASQDKYVRLWRISLGDMPGIISETSQNDLLASAHPLKAKVQTLKTNQLRFVITFEALLLGHEDWIFSATWSSTGPQLRLLTASADNSLSVWEADQLSGIWTSVTRLGEISEQKGSTSATGSSGGLWAALWSSNGDAIACLGRTGSWRLWQYDSEKEYWDARVGISGHTRSVSDIVWDLSGQYLLSTSLDQTSRLHAQWRGYGSSTWHEFSRPQIHGYDLNCIASLGPTRFVSGADEKLLRVFDEPKAVGLLLERLCGIVPESITELPEAAEVGVLGLSNKAIDEATDVDANADEISQLVSRPQLDMSQPPSEDHLARHTLWPETEKLYGHGYEISAVAASHAHSLIATACKASSIEHAVIRLYDTKDWHEIRPPLAAHTLTVCRLRFSVDDKYLLSVGRDRQWALFSRSAEQASTFSLVASNPKAHSRMLFDAAWAPLATRRVFATAGRDSQIKIWQLEEEKEGQDVSVSQVATFKRPYSVTAIDFAPSSQNNTTQVILATGEESGLLSLHNINLATWEVTSTTLDSSLHPMKAVTRLAWRPSPRETDEVNGGDEGEGSQTQVQCLAVASADCSVRLLQIEL